MDIFAISFLLNLIVVALLWWTAVRSKTNRVFWGLWAGGWSLNLVGNVAWISYELIGQRSLPPLSWIDTLYGGRYLLIALAWWSFPEMRKSGRWWLEMAGVMVLAGTAAWFSLYAPLLAATGRAWSYFLGVAIYPILDAGLIYAAGRGYQASRARLKPVIALLGLALVSYGMANLINFSARMNSIETLSDWATIFWMAADLLTGGAAVYFLITPTLQSRNLSLRNGD
jgi:hypothetical protein